MKYYIIDTPAESKETGKSYPQVRLNNLEEAFKFRHNSYPEGIPKLSASLEKGAKLTDILSQASIAGHGLLINEKVKAILANFNIMKHKFYYCPVKDLSGNTHPYFWLALVELDIINWVDFDSSIFYQKKGLKNLGNIVIKDYNHYLSIKQQIDSSTIIKSDEIIFKEKNYDFFKLPLFDNNFYVSEKLVNSLSNISGIIIKEAQI